MRSVLALLFAIIAFPVHAACFVGASVGVISNATKLDDGMTRIDLGTQAPLAGPEIGCMFLLEGTKLSPGMLARYDLMDIKASVMGADVKSHGRWMVAPTISYSLNTGTSLYGLAGIAGTKIEVPSIASATPIGLVLGGGINIDMGSSWSLFAEFDHYRLRPKDLDGVSATAVDNVFRVGARLKLIP